MVTTYTVHYDLNVKTIGRTILKVNYIDL